MEHLLALDAQNVAEAAFYLGIAGVRAGNLLVALEWMERAYELLPEHEETRIQVERLHQMLSIVSSGNSEVAGTN